MLYLLYEEHVAARRQNIVNRRGRQDETVSIVHTVLTRAGRRHVFLRK